MRRASSNLVIVSASYSFQSSEGPISLQCERSLPHFDAEETLTRLGCTLLGISQLNRTHSPEIIARHTGKL